MTDKTRRGIGIGIIGGGYMGKAHSVAMNAVAAVRSRRGRQSGTLQNKARFDTQIDVMIGDRLKPLPLY
jgi:hypothetical protein